MRVVGIPRFMNRHLERFRYFFTPAQFEHFKRYVTGLILAQGRRTVLSINRLYLDACDQSRLSRFLKDPGWSRRAVANLRRRIAHEMAVGTGACEHLVILDDTLLNRADGHCVEGAACHYAGGGRTARGHCLVTAHLLSGALSLPLDARLYVKRSHALPNTGTAKSALACDLVRKSVSGLPGSVVFLADSWYFRRDLVSAVTRWGWDWIFSVRADRKAWAGGDLHRVSALDPDGGGLCAVPGIGPVRIVGWKSPTRHKRTRWLATNRLDWPPRAVIARYSRRTMIEVFYWSAKQRLGLRDYRGRTALGVMSHCEMAFCAYTTLVALDEERAAGRRLRTLGKQCEWAVEQAAIENMRRAYRRGRLGLEWERLRCAEEETPYDDCCAAQA